MLEWARERARLTGDDLRKKFDKYPEWLSGDLTPTLKQLEGFAAATHTPFGYLLLSEPPGEPLPMADFRVIAGTALARPSANLLDTIYACQQRQEWYRDEARLQGDAPLEWVASLTANTPAVEAAAQLREQLSWGPEARQLAGDVPGAWAAIRNSMEDCGVLVMITGHVGSNTRRALDLAEFRGFALVDDLAPLVFVNGVDAKVAQVFTLVHELAHLWLGQSGLDDVDPGSEAVNVERWCNAVAAEVLVPLPELRRALSANADLLGQVAALARAFRVSKPVILGRLREAGYLTWAQYHRANEMLEQARLAAEPARKKSGGNFYPGFFVATSRRFTDALVASTLEGRTLYRDAFKMLGIRSEKAFDGVAAQLGRA
jgi:Zn-dependent peptidase ImmA (M78 family)